MKDGEARRWVRVAATGKSIGKSGCHRRGGARQIVDISAKRSAGPSSGDNRRARYRDILHAGLFRLSRLRWGGCKREGLYSRLSSSSSCAAIYLFSRGADFPVTLRLFSYRGIKMSPSLFLVEWEVKYRWHIFFLSVVQVPQYGAWNCDVRGRVNRLPLTTMLHIVNATVNKMPFFFVWDGTSFFLIMYNVLLHEVIDANRCLRKQIKEKNIMSQGSLGYCGVTEIYIFCFRIPFIFSFFFFFLATIRV